MRWWVNRISLGWAVALLAGCGGGSPGLRVVATDVVPAQDAYFLDVRLDYTFSDAVLEALHNGVPVTIQVENRVQRRRDWLWPETLVQHQLDFTLSHHALSGQYLVREGAAERRRSFPNLDAALASMRQISAWPLIQHSESLKPASLRYGVRVRLALDELPAPLRLMAYFSPGWRIGSDWVEGPVAP